MTVGELFDDFDKIYLPVDPKGKATAKLRSGELKMKYN